MGSRAFQFKNKRQKAVSKPKKESLRGDTYHFHNFQRKYEGAAACLRILFRSLITNFYLVSSKSFHVSEALVSLTLLKRKY